MKLIPVAETSELKTIAVVTRNVTSWLPFGQSVPSAAGASRRELREPLDSDESSRLD